MKTETTLNSIVLNTVTKAISRCNHCGKTNVHIINPHYSSQKEIDFWKGKALYYANIIAKGKIIV